MRGCLDRFVSGTVAVQTRPLKPAAYVRQCGVRFEVVRGDGVHVTRRNEARGAAPRLRRAWRTSDVVVASALARAARRAEYRTSPSVDLLKAGLKLERRWKIRFSGFRPISASIAVRQ